MQKNEILSYVYDFTSILLFSKESIENINSIILFGSIARGDYDEESDVDIFINLKKESGKRKMEEVVDNSINKFEAKARETYFLRGIKNPIKCIVGHLEDKEWVELRNEILSNNVMLYGVMSYKKEELSPYCLFQYSLRKLKQKKRVSILRNMIGYTSKKKKKTYSHKGLLDEVSGIKLEDNNILVPIKKATRIQDFFKKNKITPKIREI